tara:strand:- start:378 stop:821 length:444 start_codon:yes stop_codon:yes gene_type:complete
VILDNDTKEDIFRDLEIDKDSSLKDLHELILLAFKFSGEEMSSFFTVDEEWNQIDEISLMNLDDSTKSMDSINLSSLISHDNKKLLYVYDFMNMWTFFVELIEEGKLINNLKYPRIIFSNGMVPNIAPKKIFDKKDFESDYDDDFLF